MKLCYSAFFPFPQFPAVAPQSADNRTSVDISNIFTQSKRNNILADVSWGTVYAGFACVITSDNRNRKSSTADTKVHHWTDLSASHVHSIRIFIQVPFLFEYLNLSLSKKFFFFTKILCLFLVSTSNFISRLSEPSCFHYLNDNCVSRRVPR